MRPALKHHWQWQKLVHDRPVRDLVVQLFQLIVATTENVEFQLRLDSLAALTWPTMDEEVRRKKWKAQTRDGAVWYGNIKKFEDIGNYRYSVLYHFLLHASWFNSYVWSKISDLQLTWEYLLPVWDMDYEHYNYQGHTSFHVKL